MNVNEYAEWRPKYSKYDLLYNTVLHTEEQHQYHERQSIIGLAAEAGELLGLVQKAGRKGENINRDKVKDELGDVIWYVFYTLDAHGFTLEEVLDYNKEKLDARNNPDKGTI